jgi:hypothetical protein
MTTEQNIAIAVWAGCDRYDTYWALPSREWHLPEPDWTNAHWFVELLRVCAAKGLRPIVGSSVSGCWYATVGKGSRTLATADTECEALALAVLKLIESENTK